MTKSERSSADLMTVPMPLSLVATGKVNVAKREASGLVSRGSSHEDVTEARKQPSSKDFHRQADVRLPVSSSALHFGAAAPDIAT